MIKIIEPGKLRVIRCPKCECKFSYEREDVKYGNQRGYYEVVNCPCCGYVIDLLHKENVKLEKIYENEWIHKGLPEN